jgi:hypothetical protein
MKISAGEKVFRSLSLPTDNLKSMETCSLNALIKSCSRGRAIPNG